MCLRWRLFGGGEWKWERERVEDIERSPEVVYDRQTELLRGALSLVPMQKTSEPSLGSIFA